MVMYSIDYKKMRIVNIWLILCLILKLNGNFYLFFCYFCTIMYG